MKTTKKKKKEYKKPKLIAKGNYAANLCSCGKLVSHANSACGH